MIGYYVHHVGSGHLHRALAVARALGEPVTGFSSLPRPEGWPGAWIELDRDDDGHAHQATVRDRLHWAPLGHDGLRSRMGTISAWLRQAAPAVVVVDVSVEVALLVRLHGVPVVTIVPPGHRTDDAHRLGFDVADTIVGCWPPAAANMLLGVPPAVLERVVAVGALSRFPVRERSGRRPGPWRVLLMSGTGGRELDAHSLELARKETPDWEWTVLDHELGTWVEDPSPHLSDADVVVTQAGEQALAEVAAARVPAVVVPQPRPHGEQLVTGSALRAAYWPAVVLDSWPGDGWSELLERARRLDGAAWSLWCDGRAQERVVEVIRAVGAGAQP